MKNNKGFAPIAIVLIVIAVLAVGGIAYYAGKSSTPAPQNETEDNITNNPVVNSNTTTPPAQPSITVLSPNGGEKLTIGSTFTVNWKTSNLVNGKVSISLFKNYSGCLNKKPGQACSPTIDPQYNYF